MTKVRQYYASSAFREAPIIEGAAEGIYALRELGFRLAIVTARSSSQRALTEEWVGKHLPNCFEAIHYTGEFEVRKNAEGPPTFAKNNTGKAEVIRSIEAIALVDDSLDNALTCSTASIPVFLFGDHEWNKRTSQMDPDRREDYLSFAERRREDPSRWWERDNVVDLPDNVRRVRGWDALVKECRILL